MPSRTLPAKYCAKVGVIFRHFDVDEDERWKYDEVNRWAQHVRGHDMEHATYISLCEMVGADVAEGLKLRHVIEAYSLASGCEGTIDSHLASIVDEDGEAIVPGLEVEVHGLQHDKHLNGLVGHVTSRVGYDCNVATPRGTIAVNTLNLRESPPRRRTGERLALVLSPGGALLGLKDYITSRGYVIVKESTGASASKGRILQSLESVVGRLGQHDELAVLWVGPSSREGWKPYDYASCGAVSRDEVRSRTVLALPPGTRLLILEFIPRGESLVPILDFPHRLEDRGFVHVRPSSPWGEGKGMGSHVPGEYWLTTSDQPRLSGRYTLLPTKVNGWPLWGCGRKRLYSDRKGYWKVTDNPEHLTVGGVGAGYLKSSTRHPRRGELCDVSVGDELPGLVPSWHQARHQMWQEAPRTFVATQPPNTTLLSISSDDLLSVISVMSRLDLVTHRSLAAALREAGATVEVGTFHRVDADAPIHIGELPLASLDDDEPSPPYPSLPSRPLPPVTPPKQVLEVHTYPAEGWNSGAEKDQQVAPEAMHAVLERERELSREREKGLIDIIERQMAVVTRLTTPSIQPPSPPPVEPPPPPDLSPAVAEELHTVPHTAPADPAVLLEVDVPPPTPSLSATARSTPQTPSLDRTAPRGGAPHTTPASGPTVTPLASNHTLLPCGVGTDSPVFATPPQRAEPALTPSSLQQWSERVEELRAENARLEKLAAESYLQPPRPLEGPLSTPKTPIVDRLATIAALRAENRRLEGIASLARAGLWVDP